MEYMARMDHTGPEAHRRAHQLGHGLCSARALVVLLPTILMFSISLPHTAYAVPACPAGAQVTQPDGTVIKVFLRGDEHAHWHQSEDGYLISKDPATGEWRYVTAYDKVAGARAVGKSNPRAIGALKPDIATITAQAKDAQEDKAVEVQQSISLDQMAGTMHNLVVLVNFSDLTIPYSRQEYDDLFNQTDYSADGAAGSVKDYYQEISFGALTVQSTVVESVTLSRGYAYYGSNDVFGNDKRPRQMVEDALAALDSRGFDFTSVDGDSDGSVDGLTIIHAGGGEEYAGNDPDYIWSHQWSLSSPVTYDGVSMEMYHTEPARRGWDSTPATQGITRIGVICHENGHFLGLPDLYDYGYDSQGAGDFCLMAGGSWNGDYGTTPAHMSAWCLSTLRWVNPVLLSTGGSYPLEQVETSGQVYKLQGAFPSTQYFLIENRQGVGFDSALPGWQRGLLIWHIDETQANNDDQTHYKVDLEEASGTQHLELDQSSGDDADYFRLGNATAFTDTTTPDNRSYSGQALGINVVNVSATSPNMSLVLSTGMSITSITPNSALAGTAVSITNLVGEGFAAGADVVLAQTGQPDIVAADVNVVNATKITCSFSLPASASGSWDVWVTNPDSQSAVLVGGFFISSPGFTVFLTEGFESAFVNGAPPGWSRAFKTGTVDWVRNSGDHRNNGAHSGTYNALLYYGVASDHETYLITPAMHFPPGTENATLEFWHKQPYWSPDQDTLTVYYKTTAAGSWALLAGYLNDVPTWTVHTLALPEISDDYYIAFLGNAKYGYGVCIDDVTVSGIVTPEYHISGRVTAGGSGLDQVIMSGLPDHPVTAGDGSYSATVPSGWSGTVTPTKSDYRFLPRSVTYTGVIADQNEADYAGLRLTAGWLTQWGDANEPATDIGIAAIAAGAAHSVVLKADGTLLALGSNDYGQRDVPDGNDFIALDAGDWHSAAIRADGTLVAWGRNDYGQCDIVPDGNEFVAVSAGSYHTLAIRANGTLTAWGLNDCNQCDVPDGDNFTAVAAGGYHSIALRSDGSVIAWGLNEDGQCDVPVGDYIGIAAGNSHTLALKSDGSLIACGSDLDGQATAPAGNDFTAIAAAVDNSLALKVNGSLVAWGNNDYGQCSVPDGNSFYAMDAGGYHSLAISWRVEDVNGDGRLDMTDFAIMASAWMSSPPESSWNPFCDLSAPADNLVDWLDLAYIMESWLAGAE